MVCCPCSQHPTLFLLLQALCKAALLTLKGKKQAIRGSYLMLMPTVGTALTSPHINMRIVHCPTPASTRMQVHVVQLLQGW